MARIEERLPNRAGAALSVIGVAFMLMLILLILSMLLLARYFKTPITFLSNNDTNIAISIGSKVEAPVAQKAVVPTEPVAVLSAATAYISADTPWQPTDITLRAGQSFEVSVTGGQWIDEYHVLSTANGRGYTCNAETCCEPMPYEQRGALIGRIGIAGTSFLIGTGGQFTASNDGVLDLRINDCDHGLFDNSGTLEISITVLK